MHNVSTVHASERRSSLPIYQHSIDWDEFFSEYPVPDVYERTVYRWSADQTRACQNSRFLALMRHAWGNEFYRRRWSAAGIEPGDIRSADDIVKLPVFTSDDIKDDQAENPPFGLIHAQAADERRHDRNAASDALWTDRMGDEWAELRARSLYPGRTARRRAAESRDLVARELRLVRLQGLPRLHGHPAAHDGQRRRHAVAPAARARLRLGHEHRSISPTSPRSAARSLAATCAS